VGGVTLRSLLIVDDSPISRKIIRKLLPPGPFDIREAGNGIECLKLYEQAPADLVFLDLTMPGMDGFETLTRLRALDPQAKVVVVTADVQTSSQARVKELGALVVIAKPPKSEVIKLIMERFCP
jgi:two-component system, chemotaxis family, chemotaxis protein CheY